MHDLARFGLADMIECGAALRGLGTGAASMEETADRIVQHFYDRMRDRDTDERACVLVRFYKTHPWADLPPDLQEFARSRAGDYPLSPTTRCLVLLATVGAEETWSNRRRSADHQAIPLLSEEMVTRSPMISRLIQQFGLEVSLVLSPAPELIVDLDQQTFNVFHVPEALGSPYVPAQEGFVIPHGIRSALGFGGMLPTGDLFATIMFARTPIPRETADLFRTLALGVKVAVLPFAAGPVFTEEAVA